jgi:PAS domain S-box-containing protein
MKKALILFLIVLVLFSIPLIPHCANQFNISTYMVLDGLPTDIIKTIIQDQTGDVWIGTDQGLVHYNGVRMKVYHDELPSLYIKDVIIIDNQNIVVVTDMGCVLIEINELGYTFHDFLGGDTEQKEGLLQYPKKGYEDRLNQLWISEPEAMVRYQDGNFKRFIFDSTYRTNSFDYSFHTVEDQDNNLYTLSQNGTLFQWNPSKEEFTKVDLISSSDVTTVHTVYTSLNNEILLGTDIGVMNLTIGEANSFELRLCCELPDVSCIQEDLKGLYYIGTWKNGLYFSSDIHHQQNLHPIEELEFPVINDLSLTRDGSIWVSSNNGFAIIDEWLFYSIREELGNPYIISITRDTSTSLFVTNGSTIYRIVHDQFPPQIETVYKTDLGIITYIQKYQDDLLVGFSNGYIERVSETEVTRIDILSSDKKIANHIIIDKHSNIWVSFDGEIGLYKISPDQEIHHYDSIHGLQSPVHPLFLDPEGNLLCTGTYPGNFLFRYNQETDRFDELRIKNTLVLPYDLIVRDALCDTQSRIYLATNHGVFTYLEGILTQYKWDNINSDILSIALSNDRIWIGTNQGMYHIKDSQYAHFTTQQGLPSSTLSPKALYMDAQKRLWVGTANGLAYWSSGQEHSMTTPKPKIVTLTSTQGLHASATKFPPLFPFGTYLHFTFSAPVFPAEDIQYETRIIGLDSKWETIVNQHSQIYSNLPSGFYTFEMKAQKPGYLPSETIQFSFTVNPPMYLAWWAFIGYGIVFMFIFYVFKRYYHNKHEKRKIQAALTENELRTRTILKNVVDAIITIDDKGIIEAWNSAAEKMFGYTNAEIIGKNINIIVPEPHQQAHNSYMQQYLLTDEPRIIGISREVFGLRRDGSLFPMELSVSEITLNDKRLFTGIVRDISEKKRIESTLRESEKRFRSLVTNMPGIIYRCNYDKEWTMIYISEAVESITGYPSHDFVSNAKRSFASIIHPDDHETVEEYITKTLQTDTSFHLEYRLIHKTGKIIWVAESGSAILDEDKEINYLDGVILDITNEKTIRESLRESREKAAIQQGKVEMSSSILHDIGNAVSSLGTKVNKLANEGLWSETEELSNLCELIKDEKEAFIAALGNEREEAMKDFVFALKNSLTNRYQSNITQLQNALKIITHINEILHLQRRYSQDGDIIYGQKLSVHELINDALAINAASLEKRDIEIEYEANPNVPRIQGDRTRLIQVLINIIKNASEAFDEYPIEKERKITLSILNENPNHITISIRDNAMGFDPAQGERLFEKGHSTKNRGSGLGLYQCRQVIQSHGGTIWLESEGIGTGTTAFIEFPIT